MSLPALAASSPLAAGQADRAATSRPAPPVVASSVPESTRPVEAESIDRRQIEAATQELKAKLEEKGVELAIEFDDEIHRSIVKLVDSRSGEILRQIPSEEMLVLARALARSDSVGALLQTRA